MDDLHDAIENARYEECISEAAERKIPSPILPWRFPDEATIQEWKDQTLAKYRHADGSVLLPHMRSTTDDLYQPAPFTLEWVLTDSIGFFMFCTFVWDMSLKQFKAIVASFDSIIEDKESATARESIRSGVSDRSSFARSSSVARFNRDAYEDGADFMNSQLASYEARFAQIKFMIDVVRYQRVVRQVNSGDDAAKLVLNKKVEHLTNRYMMSKTYQGRKNLDHLGKDYDDIAKMPSMRRISLGTGENVDKEAVIGVYDEEPIYETPKNEKSTTTHARSSKTRRTCCLGIGGKPLDDTIKAVKRGPPFMIDMFENIEMYVIAQLKHFYWSAFTVSPAYKRLLNFLWYREKKVFEEDFIYIRKLGRGGFGLVYACKKGTSGKLYAMKAMDKKRVKIKKAEKLILNEHVVLASVDSPFVVNLKYAFQSSDNVFLILDLMTGGDLSFHLAQQGRFTRNQARYYASCIMLGVQALHNQQFVYRDLKPENILMGDDGRIKITDMGLACKVTAGLHGACGTRGYWAPEMLLRDSNGKRMSYGYSVDWFSFGCMLAEFISGVNPFRSETALKFGNSKGFSSKVGTSFSLSPTLFHMFANMFNFRTKH